MKRIETNPTDGSVTIAVPVVITFASQFTKRVILQAVQAKQVEKLKELVFKQMLESLNRSVEEGMLHRTFMEEFSKSWEDFEDEIVVHFDPQQKRINTSGKVLEELIKLNERNARRELESGSTFEQLENTDERDSGDSSSTGNG